MCIKLYGAGSHWTLKPLGWMEDWWLWIDIPARLWRHVTQSGFSVAWIQRLTTEISWTSSAEKLDRTGVKLVGRSGEMACCYPQFQVRPIWSRSCQAHLEGNQVHLEGSQVEELNRLWIIVRIIRILYRCRKLTNRYAGGKFSVGEVEKVRRVGWWSRVECRNGWRKPPRCCTMGTWWAGWWRQHGELRTEDGEVRMIDPLIVDRQTEILDHRSEDEKVRMIDRPILDHRSKGKQVRMTELDHRSTDRLVWMSDQFSLDHRSIDKLVWMSDQFRLDRRSIDKQVWRMIGWMMTWKQRRFR